MSAPGKIYSAPLLVNWSLNYSCNFSCEHCYSRFEKADELPTDQVLEAGRRLAQAGVLFANFGGGEPLLRRDLLPVSKELDGARALALDELQRLAARRGRGHGVAGRRFRQRRPLARQPPAGGARPLPQPAGELRPRRRRRRAPGARRGQADDFDGRLPDQPPGAHAAARTGEASRRGPGLPAQLQVQRQGDGAPLRTRSGAARVARLLPRGARVRRRTRRTRRSPSTTRSWRRWAPATPSTASPARPAASSRCTCARTATSPPAGSSRSCSATSCATTCRRSGASRPCSRRCGTRPRRASAPRAVTTRPVSGGAPRGPSPSAATSTPPTRTAGRTPAGEKIRRPAAADLGLGLAADRAPRGAAAPPVAGDGPRDRRRDRPRPRPDARGRLPRPGGPALRRTGRGARGLRGEPLSRARRRPPPLRSAARGPGRLSAPRMSGWT